jgi:hypothetical protein
MQPRLALQRVSRPAGHDRADVHRRRNGIVADRRWIDRDQVVEADEPEAAVGRLDGGLRRDRRGAADDAVEIVEDAKARGVSRAIERQIDLGARQPHDAAVGIEPHVTATGFDDSRDAADRLGVHAAHHPHGGFVDERETSVARDPGPPASRRERRDTAGAQPVGRGQGADGVAADDPQTVVDCEPDPTRVVSVRDAHA